MSLNHKWLEVAAFLDQMNERTEQIVNRLLRGMEAAQQGHLSPSLVRAEVLIEALNQLKKAGHEQEFDTPVEDIGFLYQLPCSFIMRRGRSYHPNDYCPNDPKIQKSGHLRVPVDADGVAVVRIERRGPG
ncbi:unnamed protein product [Sphagnum tenellum]